MTIDYPDFMQNTQPRDILTMVKGEGDTNELDYVSIITHTGEGLIKGIKTWSENDAAGARGYIKLEVDGSTLFTDVQGGTTPIYITTLWGSYSVTPYDTLDIPYHIAFTIYGKGKHFGIQDWYVYAECQYKYL